LLNATDPATGAPTDRRTWPLVLAELYESVHELASGGLSILLWINALAPRCQSPTPLRWCS